MSVFVVIGGWDYEGHDHPYGIASTLERAKEMAEKAEKASQKNYNEVEILEYEVDLYEYDYWNTPKEHK